MKHTKLKTFAVAAALLLIAAALILESLGFLTELTGIAGGLSLPRLIIGVILVCIAVIGIQKHPLHAVWYLALLFMLFEANIAHLCGREDPNLINNWVLLLCALLIKIALHLLLGGRFHGLHFGGHIPMNGLGNNTVYIDCTDFQKKYVENNLGATDIYFTNIESYTGGGRLKIENNLGHTTVSIPASWSLSMKSENNLGYIDAPGGTGSSGGPVLYLDAENNLGYLEIRFV